LGATYLGLGRFRYGLFCKLCFWNYFTFPRLLLNPQIQWEEKRQSHLIAHFPKHLPTHSPKQEFFIHPETSLLEQHNYNANIISSLATAANLVLEHKRSKTGIPYASKRRVTPRNWFGKALKAPILIDIEVHEWELY
jgi:hypothetical protein